MKKFIYQNRDSLGLLVYYYLFHNSIFAYFYRTSLYKKCNFLTSHKLFRIILVLLLCLSFHNCSPSGKVPPKAVNGVIDLRDWDFEKDGIVNLDGEWEFYWKAVPEGEDLTLSEENKNFIHVPKAWNGHFVRYRTSTKTISEEKIDGIGYAAYRLRLLINPEIKRISLLSNYQATAYRLYCDKVSKLTSGVPHFDENIHFPGKREVLYTECDSNNSSLSITIFVSNHSHYEGGLWSKIRVGNQTNILKARQNDLGIGLFVGGVIGIMAIYHFALFILRTNELSTLYFGLICVFTSIRNFVDEIGILYNFINSLNYNISLNMDYISLTLLIPIFLQYLFSLYPLEFNNKVRIFLLLISCPSMIASIFFPPLIFSKFLEYIQYTIIIYIIYGIYIVVLSIIRKREGSIILLFGFLIFSLSTVNDILKIFYIINTIEISPIGLVIFIFSQSFLLSTRFSKAFQDVAELSHTLKSSNQELELTKERATQAYLELEASQKQLVQSDKMITLGTMLAGVAHEINTPLGAIKANSENILESLRGLILKLNPSLSHLTLDELQTSLRILELSRESTTPFSSREARALRKKVISLLEERNLSNVDLLTDFILELNLVEALERKEEILFSPGLEKVLSLAYDLHGIRKKSTVIQTSAERVSKIVKSLKSFMHFDQNEKKVPADLTEGMETVLIILHNKIKMGIEVTKNYGEDVPQILCFPDELNQVWTNLIHNAIQAMDEKGSLQIDIEKVSSLQGKPDIDKRNPNYTGEYISVSIQDSGSGISPEIRQKIFQAFFTTKPAGEGSGLGLHIIGKILEKHQGALYLESEPGRTRFSVLLPIED